MNIKTVLARGGAGIAAAVVFALSVIPHPHPPGDGAGAGGGYFLETPAPAAHHEHPENGEGGTQVREPSPAAAHSGIRFTTVRSDKTSPWANTGLFAHQETRFTLRGNGSAVTAHEVTDATTVVLVSALAFAAMATAFIGAGLKVSRSRPT